MRKALLMNDKTIEVGAEVLDNITVTSSVHRIDQVVSLYINSDQTLLCVSLTHDEVLALNSTIAQYLQKCNK